MQRCRGFEEMSLVMGLDVERIHGDRDGRNWGGESGVGGG